MILFPHSRLLWACKMVYWYKVPNHLVIELISTRQVCHGVAACCVLTATTKMQVVAKYRQVILTTNFNTQLNYQSFCYNKIEFVKDTKAQLKVGIKYPVVLGQFSEYLVNCNTSKFNFLHRCQRIVYNVQQSRAQVWPSSDSNSAVFALSEHLCTWLLACDIGVVLA